MLHSKENYAHDQSNVPTRLQPTSVDVGTIPYYVKDGKYGSIRGRGSDAGMLKDSRWRV
jgi:hypothetical protein